MNYALAKVLGKLCGAAFLATMMSLGLRYKIDVLKNGKLFIAYWIALFLLTSILLITIVDTKN